MRKTLAIALALPILAFVYAGALARRSRFAPRRRSTRLATGIGLLAVSLVLVGSQLQPVPTVAQPPSKVSALADAAFTSTVSTGTTPTSPITITFPGPMDRGSVEASLQVQPATAVSVSWDETGTVMTVSPTATWKSGAYHTITVAAGVLDASGRPIPSPIRASFLIRTGTVATISATDTIGGEASVASHFRIAFDRPVDEETLDVLVSPTVEGSIEPDPTASPDAPAFIFSPADSLDPDIAYTVSLAPGVRDIDGAAVTAVPLEIRTAAVPAVVRFRPRDGWKDIDRGQTLSVRFTERMDRASTQAAWTATVGTTALAGTFSWAENDSVMVFRPKTALGYGQKVVMRVATTARSAAGLPLAETASATFTTVAKAAPRSSGASSSPRSIGGSTWAAVEAYYLTLMNCTRTGGWVTSTGSCSSPGGRGVAPLWQDAGISAKVSRPYARKLAVNNMCTHFSGGNPGDRLRAAGYSSYIWAENLGCRSGDPYKAVLGSHLFFQSEKSYGGGHYVNLMNAKYDRVGLGVWVAGGRVRLVVDFYHPL